MKAKWIRMCMALLAFALIACEAQEQIALGGTRAWIDAPRDGAVLPLAPYLVIAHGSDAAGLAYMELFVNGENIGALNCDAPAQPLVTCAAMWDPPAPGGYRLQVRATNPGGSVGNSMPVNVTVGNLTPLPVEQAAPSPTTTWTPTPIAQPTTWTAPAPTIPVLSPTPRVIIVTATFLPSLTPVISSPTATRSPVIGAATTRPTNAPTTPFSPTQTPTITQTPPPACPGAPVISSFGANPGKITRGQSTTLSWGLVSNATFVEITPGIGGVPTPGTVVVAPNTTTDYTLIARGCGGTATRVVTVLVVNPTPAFTRTSPPPPTQTPTTKPQPPAAPGNLHVINRACSTPDAIEIGWDDNSNNESGFRIRRRFRNPNTDWADIRDVGANTNRYTDYPGKSKSKNVEYGVYAYNAVGNSAETRVYVPGCVD